jgi:hypothetical protein
VTVAVVEESVQPVAIGPDYQSLIDELSSTFAAAMAEFEASLNGNHTLPELSDPSGNGKAYEKFLAIYNQLWGIQPTDDSAGNSEPVDILT